MQYAGLGIANEVGPIGDLEQSPSRTHVHHFQSQLASMGDGMEKTAVKASDLIGFAFEQGCFIGHPAILAVTEGDPEVNSRL
jgi:hypothetical protein